MASRPYPLEESNSECVTPSCSVGETTLVSDTRTTKKRRVYDYKYCPHCESYVSKSTYYVHTKVQKEVPIDDNDCYLNETENCSSHVSSAEPSSSINDEEDGPVHESCTSSVLDLVDNLDNEDQAFFMDNTTLAANSDSDSEAQVEQEEEVWSSSDENDDDDENVSTTLVTSEPLRFLLIFLLMWQSAFRISNAAMTSLIRFLRYFIQIVGHAFQINKINLLADNVPLTLKGMQRSLGLESKDWFVEFVVCPKCHSIYEYKDCVVRLANGSKESKLCCHTSMPNHPHVSQRLPCGTPLLKKQRCKSGFNLVPRKVYPYRSLKRSITKLLNKKLFIENCEQWRQREQFFPTGYLCDIYDGAVWKDFKDSNFLTVSHSYLLTLNVDWFQPFTHIQYSTGAIYLTVQNLPRVERYKQENVILVGVMPGPHESSLTINSYLSPLVEELNEFWKGVVIPVQRGNATVNINVRLALSCVACDIPASRKVCGFVGHNAKLGCNKCLREFQRFDFSGYDRDNWQPRSGSVHREQCKKLLKEKTKTSLQAAESLYGVRYSILLVLPYFDPVRFTVIDPMHNLFLGTGKHVFKVWIELGYLTSAVLAELETRLKSFRCPPDIGRLPSNISSGFGGFTANQWCNWITIYSPVALKGILLDRHLRCWLLFVRACSILQSHYIRLSDVNSADKFLVQFCRTFEEIYGAQHCTPNMHLHCHLKLSLEDYGPLHAFWCYAFEKYNGILGSVHTNRKAVESQLLKKFCQEQESSSLQLPTDEQFRLLLPRQSYLSSKLTLSNHSNSNADISKLVKISYSALVDIDSFSLAAAPTTKGLPPCHEKVLPGQLVSKLQLIYRQLYPNKQIIHFPYFYREYGRIVLAGDVIGSVKPGPNNSSSSIIMAFWPSAGDSLEALDPVQMRVGEIQYFIKHTIKVSTDPSVETHIFAYVYWKKHHPHYNWFGISATVCSDLDEEPGACCFIPVQRIGARCAFSRQPVKFPTHTETVFIACPIPLKYNI